MNLIFNTRGRDHEQKAKGENIFMREFLKGLDLDNETIDTIMAEHGKYITGLKEKNEEYKDMISKYEEDIKQLNTSIEEKDKSLENYSMVTNENKDLKAQLQMSDSNVKKEFSKFVTNEVMSKVDEEHNFADVLEDYKKENPQYFGDIQVKKVQSSPSLNGGIPQENTTNSIMNDIIRSSIK